MGHGISRARHNHTQLQYRHPTTRQTPNYKSCIQLQEFHKMRTQSRNPSVFKIGLAEGQTQKDKTGIRLQEFQSYYRSSFPTTGVPFLLQEVLSYYRRSFPTTGVPFLLQEFLSYYRSSILLQEFQSYYRSSIQLISQRSNL